MVAASHNQQRGFLVLMSQRGRAQKSGTRVKTSEAKPIDQRELSIMEMIKVKVMDKVRTIPSTKIPNRVIPRGTINHQGANTKPNAQIKMDCYMGPHQAAPKLFIMNQGATYGAGLNICMQLQ